MALPAAVVFMAQPDNFSLYQPIVLGALWLGARGLKGNARAFVAAGALVGLAMLARNDGILVGAALGLLFLWDRFRAWRPVVRQPCRGGRRFASLGLFVLVMAPWWARQLAVFGSISPSSASGRILWIRSLAEMNSIEGRPTLCDLPRPGDRPARLEPPRRARSRPSSASSSSSPASSWLR